MIRRVLLTIIFLVAYSCFAGGPSGGGVGHAANRFDFHNIDYYYLIHSDSSTLHSECRQECYEDCRVEEKYTNYSKCYIECMIGCQDIDCIHKEIYAGPGGGGAGTGGQEKFLWK